LGKAESEKQETGDIGALLRHWSVHPLFFNFNDNNENNNNNNNK
jgi:hypothetical protein